MNKLLIYLILWISCKVTYCVQFETTIVENLILNLKTDCDHQMRPFIITFNGRFHSSVCCQVVWNTPLVSDGKFGFGYETAQIVQSDGSLACKKIPSLGFFSSTYLEHTTKTKKRNWSPIFVLCNFLFKQIEIQNKLFVNNAKNGNLRITFSPITR